MILGGGGVGGGGGACHQGAVGLATKARWGHGRHNYLGEAGFKVVSGLVARCLGLLIL